MSIHLVRRGVEYASSQLASTVDNNSDQPGAPDGAPMKVSGWVLGLFSVIALALFLIFGAVEYTYGKVVSSLAAIEDSHPDIHVRIDSNANANADEYADADVDSIKPVGPGPVDAEVASPSGQGKPVTNKLRTAVAHLRARAGPWSRFRGLSMFLVYEITQRTLLCMFGVYTDTFLSQFIIHLLINILLANLQLAWIHIVISEPSPKRWYQRIPSFSDWRRIAPVVAFQHLAIRAAFYIPLSLTQFFGGWDSIQSNPSSDGNNNMSLHSACMMIAVAAGPAILAIFVAIPVSAIFVRVAASMLPEEHEAIVPFDRSFGGKVVPAILGGSGRVSIADAWRTFDWPARVRYYKVIGKVIGIEAVIGLGIMAVFAGQAYYLGPELRGILAGTQS